MTSASRAGALATSYAAISADPDARLTVREQEPAETRDLGPPWVDGGALERGETNAWERLQASAVEVTGDVDQKTVGLAMATLVAPFLSVPLLAYARDRRVPEIRLADVTFRTLPDYAHEAVIAPVAFSCLAGDAEGVADARGRVVDDEAALQGRFVAIVEQVLGPLVAGLHERMSVAPAAVWGVAAGTLAWGLAEQAIADGGVDAAIAFARQCIGRSALLARRPPDLFRFDAPPGPWFGLKAPSCCRAYRWAGREGVLCSSCPLRDDASRLQLLVDWRVSVASAG